MSSPWQYRPRKVPSIAASTRLRILTPAVCEVRRRLVEILHRQAEVVQADLGARARAFLRAVREDFDELRVGDSNVRQPQ